MKIHTNANRISFGKGDDFWTNVFPTPLTSQFRKDIAKFGHALSIIKALEPIFAMIPVHVMLKMFNFSTDFGEKMVYPLVALFFGTGNQTPYISSAILVCIALRCSGANTNNGQSRSVSSKIPACACSNTMRRVYLLAFLPCLPFRRSA